MKDEIRVVSALSVVTPDGKPHRYQFGVGFRHGELDFTDVYVRMRDETSTHEGRWLPLPEVLEAVWVVAQQPPVAAN